MTTGAICPIPILFFLGNDGNPAVGGSVLTTVGGSPASTYQDVGLTTPLPNPIPLNSRGEVSTSGGASAQCFLTPDVVYTFTLYDSGGNQLWVATYVNGLVISQSSVGAALWPQTAQEAAAGITPTYYYYEPGDLRRYGVKGDNTTDDTIALNAIGSASWTSNVTFTLVAGMVCKTTDTVTFAGPYTALMMDPSAYINYSGTADRACLVIGNDAQVITGREYNLSVQFANNANDYLSNSCVGVQIRGCFQGNNVRLNYALGFTKNWQILGTNTSGIAYNTFSLGICGNGTYGLDIRSNAANCFINENLFLGGDFQIYSNFGATAAGVAYGIVFAAESGAYTGQNKNHFIKPCFQITQGGVSADRIPIIFSNAGGSNQFTNCRFEGLNGECVRIASDTVAVRSNLIDIGYVSTTAGTITAFMTETDGGLSYGNRISLNGVPLATTFYSGNLHSRSWISDTDTCKVQGMFFQSSASGTEQSSGTAKVGKDYMILYSTAMGCYLDTSVCREFRLISEIQGALGGRLVFTLYNSSNTQITRSDAMTFGGVQTDTNYGGRRFYQGADGTATLDFRVDSDVAYMKIMFNGGTNPCNLKSFSVTAYVTDRFPTITFTPTAQNFGAGLYGGPFAPKQYTSTTDPTALGGPYTERGFTVGNEAAAAGATSTGWICTLGGWNAPAWANTTAYKLNEMVNNDTGKIYYCSQAGTSAGSGGPTGTGAGEITDGTCKWFYVGNPTGLNATWSALPNQNAT